MPFLHETMDTNRRHNRFRVDQVEHRSAEVQNAADSSERDYDTPAVPTVDQLRQMLQNQTDSSELVLDRIRRKVQSGDYLTREAAEESARRLLDSGDLADGQDD